MSDVRLDDVSTDTMAQAAESGGVSRDDVAMARRPAWKRAFDVVGAFGLIIAFSPMLLMVCALIWLGDRHSPIFRHRRIGLDGRYFYCLKFRSMKPNAAAELKRLLATDPAARAEWEKTQKLKFDPRVTAVGRMLRRTSLDELPQLFNVLRGEMSLVGPRPIVDEEIKHYGPHFRTYTSCRPGMTGLWQVSGRSDTSYIKRVALDVTYARSISIANDLSILARTVGVVLKARGAV